MRIYEVLDCCHATHHISLALAAQGLNSEERVSLYRMYRTMLRNGQWQEIVANFKEIAGAFPFCVRLKGLVF